MSLKIIGQCTTAQVVQWRLKGESYEMIAERLGITPQGARVAVQRAYNDLAGSIKETTEELRALELGRLDAMQEKLWEKREDPFVAKQLLQISHQRCKIAGLYAPIKAEIVDKNGRPVPYDPASIAAEITSIGSLVQASAGRPGTNTGTDGASETGMDSASYPGGNNRGSSN